MRLSQLLVATLRQDPSGTMSPGYRVLVRAGYVRPGADGVSILPLGLAVLEQVAGMLLAPLLEQGWPRVALPDKDATSDARSAGAGEATLRPLSGPGRFLEPCMPAALLPLVDSYKRLPLKAYQLGWRREVPGYASAEFPSRVRRLLELWVLADRADLDSLQAEVAAMISACLRRLGVEAVSTTPSGLPGAAVEILLPSAAGRDPLLTCSACGYLARPELVGLQADTDASRQLPIERVATPGADTIASLCACLGIPPEETAKVLFLAGKAAAGKPDETLIVLVRGDREASLSKVMQASGWNALRRADDTEILRTGAVPGYASPVGLAHPWVLVDAAVAESKNLVAGANAPGYHLRNVNCGRDFSPWRVGDLSNAIEGDPCPQCAARLGPARGVVVGAIAETSGVGPPPRTKYAAADGKSRELESVHLVVDVTTVLGVLAGEQSDERGLTWHEAVAPCVAHVLGLPPQEQQAVDLYRQLKAQGIRVLLDDRELSAGVKLKDADLLGMPVRVTVSRRSTEQGGAEVHWRKTGESTVVPLESVADRIRRFTA